MPAILTENSYGKSAVRLVRVVRGADRHEVRDLTVDIAFEGDFEAVHLEGDNAPVLPTDTMKNTVYALARESAIPSPEEFGIELAQHFLGTVPHLSRVRVDLAEHGWERLTVNGKPHTHAFRRAGEERRLARVAATRRGTTVEAGVEDLTVLKTTGSAFEGYMRDRFTTLPETKDRIFATAIRAVWRYGDAERGIDFNAAWEGGRAALLETFATHDESRSVQHTLYAMGAAAIERVAAIEEIHLSLPNKHHLLVDLGRFGMENPNEVFVATTEPYGLIEATLMRE